MLDDHLSSQFQAKKALEVSQPVRQSTTHPNPQAEVNQSANDENCKGEKVLPLDFVKKDLAGL